MKRVNRNALAKYLVRVVNDPLPFDTCTFTRILHDKSVTRFYIRQSILLKYCINSIICNLAPYPKPTWTFWIIPQYRTANKRNQLVQKRNYLCCPRMFHSANHTAYLSNCVYIKWHVVFGYMYYIILLNKFICLSISYSLNNKSSENRK